MKRFSNSLIAIALSLAFSTITFAQVAPATPATVNTPSVVLVSVDPTGACTMNNLYAPVFMTVNVNTSTISKCLGGNWVPQTVYLTGAAYTNATTTLTNVTGIAFPVAANGNYSITCQLVWQASAATAGPKWTFTGPASPTAATISAFSNVTASTYSAGTSGTLGTSVNNAGTVTTVTNFTDLVTLQLLNGTTAGTIQLQAAANGVGTLTVQPGSWCKL